MVSLNMVIRGTYDVSVLSERVAVRGRVPFVRRHFDARDRSAVIGIVVDNYVFVASIGFCLFRKVG